MKVRLPVVLSIRKLGDIVAVGVQYVHEVSGRINTQFARIVPPGPCPSWVQEPAIRVDIEGYDTVVPPVQSIKVITIRTDVDP